MFWLSTPGIIFFSTLYWNWNSVNAKTAIDTTNMPRNKKIFLQKKKDIYMKHKQEARGNNILGICTIVYNI